MFNVLANHKATLNKLAELICNVKDCANEIYTEEFGVEYKKKFGDTVIKNTDEEFIVLFIGAFVSGKTSMINALISGEFFPTGFLPMTETAIVCELHYGESKRITVYPKGGEDPFDIEPSAEMIGKYVSLSTDDAINSMEKNDEGKESDARINAKFEKMVIYWPLDILKNGIVLVDTPGLNDPYINDYILNDCLPKADAIVYVMDLQHSYMASDKNQLETINALGRRNIVTAYTFYDIVKRYFRRDPDKLIAIRNRLIQYTLKHTELGEESIHFLDSISGLDAKINGDSEAWRKSGFAKFEEYLGKYLVESKGTEQVKKIVDTIANQVDTIIADAEGFNSVAEHVAEQNAAEFKDLLDEKEKHLQSVREESLKVATNYRESLESCLPKVEQLVRRFITQELPTLINLDDFRPETTWPTGFSRLNPFAVREKAKALKDECQQEILRRMNLAYKKWALSTLTQYLKSPVQKSPQGNYFPSEPFIVKNLDFPEYVFDIMPLRIIADPDISSDEKIKFLVVEYATKFFSDPAFKDDVDLIINNIMTDVKTYVENLCAGAEEILKAEIIHADKVFHQMIEKSEFDSATKKALISRHRATVDKLHDIKVAVLKIGKEYSYN